MGVFSLIFQSYFEMLIILDTKESRRPVQPHHKPQVRKPTLSERTWGEKNKHSHHTNRKLFGMDGETQEGHDGPFGFGTIRTLREYERYAGLLFEKRAVDQHCLDKKYAPSPVIEDEEEWFSRMY